MSLENESESPVLQIHVIANRVQMQPCALNLSQGIRLHMHPLTEAHHICPKSWWLEAHKPVATPMIVLCPDCHYGTHVCLDGLIHGWDLSLMPIEWRDLAARGFAIAAENGLTPTSTL